MKNLLTAKKIDATTGNIWKQLLLYATPLIIAALIQNCFNSVDLIVLGNLADSGAIASVGATGSIVSLMARLINLFVLSPIVAACAAMFALSPFGTATLSRSRFSASHFIADFFCASVYLRVILFTSFLFYIVSHIYLLHK
jgi:hypothetical protein